MEPQEKGEVAVAFLRAAASGHPRQVAERSVASHCRHHNPFFPAGMDALMEAMEDAARENPETALDVKRVLVDGDHVAVHSHVRHRPGDLGIAVVHLFRFEGDRIVEFWDVGQAVPEDSPNEEGMF